MGESLRAWTPLLGCWLLTACVASTGSPSGPAPSGDSQGSSAVLTWSRDGGFAGFCDELKVSASGDLTISSCRSAASRTGKLSNGDLARLDRWRASFGAVAIEMTDSAAADALTLQLTLAGAGSGKPTESEQQQMLDWAQNVYTQNAP
jgi:hypothetical protein